jgi:hypothetical protein
MLTSLAASTHPARAIVAAGDKDTLALVESLATTLARPGAYGAPHPHFELIALYSTRANARIGSTAPLNLAAAAIAPGRDALFCTDDCLFEATTLATAVATLNARFPTGDGSVGLAQDNLTPDQAYPLAFPLLGRALIARFTSKAHSTAGHLFWPGYFHLYNDLELGLTLTCMGNWAYEPAAKLRHFHPCTGEPEDHTFRRALTRFQDDAAAFKSRRTAGTLWGIDADTA